MKASLMEMAVALTKVGIKERTTKTILLNFVRLGCKGAVWFYSTPSYGDGHCMYATTCKCNITHRYYLF